MHEEPRVEAARPPHAAGAALRELPTRELVGELARTAGALARKELELAGAEVKADLRAELELVGALGVAATCGILGAQLLLAAAVLALVEAGLLAGWAAALVVAAAVLAVGAAAGAWGWGRRVRRPLDGTRRSLREGARWVREQVA